MFHLNAWSYYWLAWIMAFLVPELINVFRNPAGTLSETVWAVEHVNISQPFDFRMWTDVHWAVAALVWALFAWLSLHLPFGLLR